MRRLTGFDPGRDAVKTLTTIITYAMCINVFFYLLEVFTAFYSGIPGHQHPLVFLFAGHEGHVSWVTNWMWAAVVMAAASLIILIPPQWRTGPLLPLALVMLVAASWIDKGLGLLIGGFTPNMFETVTEYAPTGREIIVALGVYAVGALVLSLASIASKNLIPGAIIPVGIVTSLVGVPFFLSIILRHRGQV